MKLINVGSLGLLAWLALGATPAFCQTSTVPVAAPDAARLSPGAAEVVRLAQAGVDDTVVLGYVENSQAPFALTADDIVYLRDVGISSTVLTAMLNRDKALPAQSTAYTYDQRLYTPATGAVMTPVPQPGVPQPAVPAPPADARPPVYVNNGAPPDVNYFYNDLSPYGSWVDLDGYGWCWQPSVVVVNRQWQPYCDGGHWVFTNARLVLAV